jgi:hypothetical protein
MTKSTCFKVAVQWLNETSACIFCTSRLITIRTYSLPSLNTF